MKLPQDSQPAQTRDARPYLFFLAALIILADRLSKLWIVHHLEPGRYLTVIPGIFRISNVRNTGAAFSLFAESLSPALVRNALIVFSVMAALVVFAMLWRTGRAISLTGVALALILGGALGNLYDRIHLSYVVDFLAVQIVGYHWPDFNVADSAIVTGACLLLLEILRPQPAVASRPN